MIDKNDLRRLLDYNVWANHRIVRTAATLPVEEFRKDLSSSHGGVRGTLTHILSAEWIWLERWKGVSPSRMMDEGEFADIVALSNRWKAVQEHCSVWFEGLAEAATLQQVRYTTMAGKAYEAPLWQLVQHTVNHSSYHRGQIATLLRLLNAKPISTDLLIWDRERSPQT